MRNTSISPELFKKNRKKLASRLPGKSVAIVHSNDQMQRNGDQYFKFRQSSDLFYLTGINQEKTILLLCPEYPDKNLREILFIIKADKTLEVWEGHKLTKNEANEISGIKTVKHLEDFELTLHQLMIHGENVLMNSQEMLKFIPGLKSRDERKAEELTHKYPLHSFHRLAPLLHALRVIKSQAEINVIKQSIEITKEAFLNVAKDLRPGKKEYEIEAELTYHFLRKGASGHAFHPIVASGKNACFLHYIENNQECKDGDLLLMDFGAEYLNYASDCSRTLPVNGKFTERQKEIYQSVLSVFKYARGLMKPGTTINKFHHKVCEKLEQEHLKLGLYTHEDIKAQDPASPMWFKYYMHGTSHFMGLDVHDVGSKDQEFVPGMVLTCEPGIYIPEEGIGIRLENDILITPDGNEDLMADIPIEPDDIESLMNTNNL